MLCPDIIGCNSVDQEDVGTCDIAVIKRKCDRILLSRVFLARFYAGSCKTECKLEVPVLLYLYQLS